MILIFRKCASRGEAVHAVAVFGVGLVGGALTQALMRQGEAQALTLPLDWNDPSQRAVDLARLDNAIHAQPSLDMLDIVWSAGRAGFGASEADLACEIAAFSDILNWVRSSSSRMRAGQSRLHVVSSAGGLFEGQRFVDDCSQPLPRRPYGVAKLEQEHRAAELSADMPVQIYRPSSIYGFSGDHGRAGLINTLIANAKRHATSRIFGGLDTVRDYVLTSDIGEFIARRIIQPDGDSRTFTLASGKPASVREIVGIVGKVIGKPLHLKLDPLPSNASHITFRTSALPDDWQPTDLATGIRLVMSQLSMNFEAGARRCRLTSAVEQSRG